MKNKATEWSSFLWVTFKLLMINIFKFVATKNGPLGWILIKAGPLMLDKLIKPWYQAVVRKFKRSRMEKEGEEHSREIRDASTDNVDDIYTDILK